MKNALLLVLLTLVMVATGFLLFDLSSIDRANIQAATEAADEYRADAQRQEAGCIVLPPPQAKSCVAEARNSAREYQREQSDLAAQQVAAWWSKIMGWAAVLATALSAIGVGLIYSTFRQTLAQAKDIEKSVIAAGRSATAMEDVAKSMAINAEQVVRSVGISAEIAEQQRVFSQMQMRAYVSVLIGGGLYQTKDLRFEVRPQIVNSGNTPARNVRWRITADVLPVPLPDDFKFPLPETISGGSILGPHQDAFMGFVLPDRVPDDESDNVRLGLEKGLYLWGVLSYEDVFRKTHRCTFAQHVFWVQTGEPDKDGIFPASVRGFYLPKHNCAN